MSTPVPDPEPPSQVSLHDLVEHCRRLSASLQRAGTPAEKVPELFARGLSAVCAQCGGRISGAELHALVPDQISPLIEPRVERVRHGYCPRTDCSSYYCRMEYAPVEGADWGRILAGDDSAEQDEQARAIDEAAAQAARHRAGRRLVIWRITAGLAGVFVLLLLRQWYLGGAIPFLREPERFVVDPASINQAGQER